MFNHHDLFAPSTLRLSDSTTFAATEFPTADSLAQEVLQAIKDKSGTNITLHPDSRAEFTNDLLFELSNESGRHVIHMNPTTGESYVMTHPPKRPGEKDLLPAVKNISLPSAPQQTAKRAAQRIFEDADLPGSPQPIGWSKLNFLALVDDQPARITYVLKDGHIDVTAYDQSLAMPTRQFLLRMHTTHGQSPHWNGRSFWSLFVDAMAIAMVGWGLTGVVMWWQIKRTRWIGTAVLLGSIATAAWVTISVYHFYWTTKL